MSRDPQRRPLGSTYRLQLPGLGFSGARAAVPYLDGLGIETLYVSPLLRAAPGSTHGYDVVDPTTLDPALGTRLEYEALLDELGSHGMRLLIDIVPNHMAAVAENRWWWDVLASGRASRFAEVFDIDWDAGGGRVVLPVLGRPLREVLERGELTVTGDHLTYFHQRFPLAAPGATGASPGPGAPALQALLDLQHYRLVHWRSGRFLCNYRRFFDVDGLVGVQVERPEVYEMTHAAIIELAADERVAGVRVDHVDGLADPAAYLDRLRRDLDGLAGPRRVVVVEKITARDERLPAGWAADGTTGYEMIDLVGGVQLAPEFGADVAPFAELARQAKRCVAREIFPGLVARVAQLGVDAMARTCPGADVAAGDLEPAVVELTACLEVYRVYGASQSDRDQVGRAAARASERLEPDARRAMDRFVHGVLSGHAEWQEVTRRWHQLTSAVAAKGVEDTALYQVDGALAAAEVGSDPGRPVDVAAFHGEMARRPSDSLNATATHDTKRGLDTRARLAVLREVPELWEHHLDRWERACRPLVVEHHGAPDAADRRMVFQTLFALWGPARDGLESRLVDYVRKAAREAKRWTSWRDPDVGYEAALEALVGALLDPRASAVEHDMDALVATSGPVSALYAVVQLVVSATAPGVPDIYQGSELWAPVLVDPDNRRPVDFAGGRARLEALGPTCELEDRLARWWDGTAKLATIRVLLALRRRRPALFAQGRYVALHVQGRWADHVLAFARRHLDDWAVTVVPFRVVQVAGSLRCPVGADWGDTAVHMPAGAPAMWHSLFAGADMGGGRELAVADVLARSPVEVLVAPV